MSLRRRLTLLITVAVAVAIAVCAGASWLLVRGQLYGQVVEQIERPVPDEQVARALMACGQPSAYSPKMDPAGRSWQVIRSDGTVCPGGYAQITPTAQEIALTASGGAPIVREATTEDGASVLVHTELFRPGPHAGELPGPLALSVFRPIDDIDAALGVLGLVLTAVTAVGVLGAALAGLWLARTALHPVGRLTGVVEHIARTEDLTVRIPVAGTDEIARLSASFNTMTAALSSSRDRQRRLVADAGHELRTPLTSLRTNIDLLLRSENTGRPLDPDAKRRLLVSVKEQFEEMSSLIGDLLELSRNAETGELSTDVEFHDVVAAAVERARRRGPGLRFDVELRPWRVHGDARGLARAAVNVLDNAVKFSPPGGQVTVRLRDGVLTVRDEGPGIPDDELPHVFDRFWRSPSARSLPGSGLGLAIVAQAVRGACGEVTLASPPDGGTLATIRLPGSEPAP
ncbi:sensor histidine kinase [Acrocarpospora catenulata]|uniref:sensor histidine kinase n=1 Tax=Acrocarpospora catenulata TaxID=2836182 RepID=UPI0027E189D0|nr:HAMP domain-containing sensor histidine kinase [Acrocarpospora catenulata]